MSATRLATDVYLIESELTDGGRTELTRAADLPGCMAQVAELALSGHKIFAIHHRGEQIRHPAVTAMILLVRRRTILDSLAISFGLTAQETENFFGHLLMDEAITIQSFLPPAISAGQRRKRSGSGRHAARILIEPLVAETRPEIDSWAEVNSTLPLEKLGTQDCSRRSTDVQGGMAE
jgi:hypothetical protein